MQQYIENATIAECRV